MAICGKPNAGKSSLFNALVGEVDRRPFLTKPGGSEQTSNRKPTDHLKMRSKRLFYDSKEIHENSEPESCHNFHKAWRNSIPLMFLDPGSDHCQRHSWKHHGCGGCLFGGIQRDSRHHLVANSSGTLFRCGFWDEV